MKAVPDEHAATVIEERDLAFAIPANFRDGTPDADSVKLRPGTTSSRVQIETPHTCEVELIDLRRALRLAEEANR